MTKPLCRRREFPATVRAPARSGCSSSRNRARRAGASPKRRPLNRETASANSIACHSSCISSARGKLPGQNSTNGRTPMAASKTPSAPPKSPNTLLSVRHWRTRRPRLAPSATRMAISRSRETARASNRLATFTHAISNAKLTAPINSHSVDLTSPTFGRSGSATKLRPASIPDIVRPTDGRSAPAPSAPRQASRRAVGAPKPECRDANCDFANSLRRFARAG